MLNRIFTATVLLFFLISYAFIYIGDENPKAQYVIKNYDEKIKAKLLPAYCRYTGNRGFGTPQFKELCKINGEAWRHMHHYCKGLDKINEAFKQFNQVHNEQLFKSKIRYAIEEFDYVLQRADSKFKPKPMILVKKGQTLMLIREGGEAAKCFWEAIMLRRDYIPAYVAFSNYYLGFGNHNEARRVIKLGLKYAPESKLLKSELAKLGESEDSRKGSQNSKK